MDEVLQNNPPYRPYVPEYSLKIDYTDRCLFSSSTSFAGIKGPAVEMIVYLKIDRNYWLNAVRATNLKRQQQLQLQLQQPPQE